MLCFDHSAVPYVSRACVVGPAEQQARPPSAASIMSSHLGHVRSIGSRNVDSFDNIQALVHRRKPEPVSSHSWCTGPCCKPMARNRSCAFSNVLFVPPRTFHVLSDDDSEPTSSWTTFLHNRFYGGPFTGEKSHSMWTPTRAPSSAAANVTRIITEPVFLAADLHSNPAHNQLDSVYPAMVALLRLRNAMPDSNSIRLPHPINDSISFLLLDSPTYTHFHRRTRERTWATTAMGPSIDLDQLRLACPRPGCLLRTAFVGAGHVGLTTDMHNVIGGAREFRSIFRFTQRLYHRFRVPLPTRVPLLSDGGGATAAPVKILVIKTKREVSNLREFVDRISSAAYRGAFAKMIRLESMTFAEQLSEMRSCAVQVSGVGSAQINNYLLPPGAVAVALGWRYPAAAGGTRLNITYFDSHLLHSLDHVRSLFYPSYSTWELALGSQVVRLDMQKAMRVVNQAIDVHLSIYPLPVPFEENANSLDAAFTAAVRATDGRLLRMRSNDVDFDNKDELGPIKGCKQSINGVIELLEQSNARACGWGKQAAMALSSVGLAASPAEMRRSSNPTRVNPWLKPHPSSAGADTTPRMAAKAAHIDSVARMRHQMMTRNAHG